MVNILKQEFSIPGEKIIILEEQKELEMQIEIEKQLEQKKQLEIEKIEKEEQ
ncbi:hypothetical protein LCGC14_1299680, partial [marine sediment metagenome]